MELRVRVQRHLVVAWIAGDNGDWVFTLCRRGFEEMIGERLKTGEERTVNVTGELVEETRK